MKEVFVTWEGGDLDSLIPSEEIQVDVDLFNSQTKVFRLKHNQLCKDMIDYIRMITKVEDKDAVSEMAVALILKIQEEMFKTVDL